MEMFKILKTSRWAHPVAGMIRHDIRTIKGAEIFLIHLFHFDSKWKWLLCERCCTAPVAAFVQCEESCAEWKRRSWFIWTTSVFTADTEHSSSCPTCYRLNYSSVVHSLNLQPPHLCNNPPIMCVFQGVWCFPSRGRAGPGCGALLSCSHSNIALVPASLAQGLQPPPSSDRQETNIRER